MYDVAIIGGGLNGVVTAGMLASKGIKTVLVDQNILANRLTKRQDGRGIAVARFSKNILANYGIWQQFKTNYGIVNKVVVADGTEPFLMKLDNDLVDGHSLGYIIEHDDLLRQLYNFAIKQGTLKILDNTRLLNFVIEQNKVTLNLSNQEKIYIRLLIAADGKNSSIKQQLNITSTDISYNQSALVFKIRHEKEHCNIAYEHFYKAGPFAILPLKNKHFSSVVWTEKTDKAKIFVAMSKEEMGYFVQEKCKLTHGNIEISSKIFSYPLSLVFANKYYDKRTILIGDSLHFIHPIAGQGFNLSLRDIHHLTNLIVEYNNLGLDIGCADLSNKFEQGRKLDNYAMIVFTDILNRIFSNNSKVLSFLRKVGMSFIDLQPSLQKLLINYAWTKKN